MQFGVLLIACTLTSLKLVRGVWLSINVDCPHLVDVVLTFPYDIEFTFYPTDHFVPQTISAKIFFEPHMRRRVFSRSTSFVNKSDIVVFRNTQDLHLRHKDEMLLYMDYTDKEGNNVQSTIFNYHIYDNFDGFDSVFMSTKYVVRWESPEDQPKKILQPPVSQINEGSLPDAMPKGEWFEVEAPETSTQLPLQPFQRSADPQWVFPDQTLLAPFKQSELVDPPTMLSPEDELKSVFEDVFNEPIRESNLSKNATKTKLDYDASDRLLNTTPSVNRTSRRLLLTGDSVTLVINSDARVFIGNIIIGDLLLPQLTPNILHAQFVPEGLLFEMAAVKDAVEILTEAKRLQGSGVWDYAIKETELNFINVKLHERG